MSASAVPAGMIQALLPAFPREREIRALARTNPTVAECLALVDANGHEPVEALAVAVLELARIDQERTDELMAVRLARPPVRFELPDRLDDGECIRCRCVECPGCEGAGGAA